MLTFLKFVYLQESRHFIPQYREWGVIAPNGTKVDGGSHPKANTHQNLIKRHARETGQNKKDYLQYAHVDAGHHGYSLIRGEANKRSVEAALKHFDYLPHHRSGNVAAEFVDRHRILSDDHHKAKLRLRQLARDLN